MCPESPTPRVTCLCTGDAFSRSQHPSKGHELAPPHVCVAGRRPPRLVHDLLRFNSLYSVKLLRLVRHGIRARGHVVAGLAMRVTVHGPMHLLKKLARQAIVPAERAHVLWRQHDGATAHGSKALLKVREAKVA